MASRNAKPARCSSARATNPSEVTALAILFRDVLPVGPAAAFATVLKVIHALGLKLKVFSHWWVWVAIVLLVAIIGLMTAVAKPYFKRVKAACEVRPSGVPRVSDEELGEILRSPTAHVVTAIGVIGLVAILYLMVFQPGVV